MMPKSASRPMPTLKHAHTRQRPRRAHRISVMAAANIDSEDFDDAEGRRAHRITGRVL